MKWKRIRINLTVFMRIMTQDAVINVKTLKGIPTGTQFINLCVYPHIGMIEMIIQHESFPDLKQGDEIPLHEDLLFEDGRVQLFDKLPGGIKLN